MKKHLLLIVFLLLISGCSNVNELSVDQTIETFAYKENKTNIYRVGYKYYLPLGMQVDDQTLYNEVITNNKYNFYLYVDVISYLNKTEVGYQKVNDALYSNNFEYNNKYGYLEINNKENDKYLIEIMYNYAKIEVIVDYSDINESIIYAINVLKSIDYNDEVIENNLGNDVINFTDEEYNIFNTTKSDSNYLNYDNNYVKPEEEDFDQDLLN